MTGIKHYRRGMAEQEEEKSQKGVIRGEEF